MGCNDTRSQAKMQAHRQVLAGGAGVRLIDILNNRYPFIHGSSTTALDRS
jgi:hypothetical protein